MTAKARAAALADEINKYMGGKALTMGSNQKSRVQYLSTGILPVDVALGGGLARGRYTVFSGAYSTLKSYIGLSAIAEVQRNGGIAALIDTEHAYDPVWAESIGVKTNELILWPNPEDEETHTGEEALDAAEAMIRNRVDLIVFDSIAATLPQTEAGKRLSKESVQPGRQAALFSLAFRKMTAANTSTAVMMINQMREQIGVTFGPTEKQPGGRATGFYASIIVNIRPAGKLTKDIKQYVGDKYQSGKETIGQTYRLVVEKSKLNKPWREIFFNWRLDGNGVDVAAFCFNQGVDLGVIEQRGQMWDFDGFVVRGREAFLTALYADDQTRMNLENLVRTHHSLPLLGVPATARKKAAASKALSSSATAAVPTRGRGRAASASTAATKKSLRK